MCLAVPSKIVQIQDTTAIVDITGVKREVSLLLMPEEVSVGDYVLVHTGFAISKIDEQSALESIRLLREYIELMDKEAEAMPADANEFTKPAYEET